jgi:hypothetical protein
MKNILLLAATFALAITAVARPGQASAPDTIHYPDLRTLTPSTLSIQAGPPRLLRLSNVIWNAGDGRMELRPQNNSQAQTTDAYQRLYSRDSNGDPYLTGEILVGTFIFHPTHNHWHFEDFARYELRNIAGDGSIGSDVLGLSDKVSFCLLDSMSIDLTLEHAEPFAYTSCGQSVLQGISVGWGDLYSSDLPGQTIDITGVADGDYWLLSTADPNNLLLETEDNNNTGVVKVRIQGNSVSVISTDTDLDARPDEIDNCPSTPNAGQENDVHAGTPAGDACEDPDADAVFDATDNCPDTANPSQQNSVHPGTTAGDACEDPDADAVLDATDNCPDTANAGQENSVHPGTTVGDACEDPDADAVSDATDNCPDAANPGQQNSIHPGTPTGDACEDPDADAIFDAGDNCPDTANPNQNDSDGDGLGDACDGDMDGDGTPNESDGDIDGDGHWNTEEAAKGSSSLDPGSEPERCDGLDNDGDAQTDEAPTGAGWDIDGDTVKDCLDASVDSDGDGVVNTLDADDDGDGFSDIQEQGMATDTLGPCSTQASHDAGPSDRDGDRDADVGDVIASFSGKILNPARYDARSDANGDGSNNIGDVLVLYGGNKILTRCLPLTFANSTGGPVDSVHIELDSAVSSLLAARDSGLAGWSERSLSGGGLVIDIARPDSLGDLASSGTLAIVLHTVSMASPGVTSCQWALEGIDSGPC